MTPRSQTFLQVRSNRNILTSEVSFVNYDEQHSFHSHRYHELLLVTSGDFVAISPNAYLSHRGACLLLYRIGCPHNQINRSSVVYERFYFDFCPDFCAIPPSAAELFTADGADAVLIPLSVRKAQQLAAVARIMQELAASREEPGTDERLQMLMGYILSEFARQYHRQTMPLRQTNDLYLTRVAEYISAHLHEKLTIDRIAAHFHVGRTKLSADFSTYLSMTINQYINTERINRARELLDAGESVDRTAELCGFADSAYFIRVFRRYEQMTPLQYKYRGNADSTVDG